MIGKNKGRNYKAFRTGRIGKNKGRNYKAFRTGRIGKKKYENSFFTVATVGLIVLEWIKAGYIDINETESVTLSLYY